MDNNVTITESARGQIVVQPASGAGGFKTRGHVVAESVGGRWSKRERGYILTARQLEEFRSIMAVLGSVEVSRA